MKQLAKALTSMAGFAIHRDKPSTRSEYRLNANHEMVLLPLIRELGPAFFFVEIGANDGKSSDPFHELIKEFGLRGILVEPEPTAFERLCQTYSTSKNLVFENAAVASKNGILTLFRLKPDYQTVPGVRNINFDSRITSFDPQLVLKHIGYAGPPEDVLDVIVVPSLTPSELLRRHGVEEVSYLQIDTEGADWEILQAWDFVQSPPRAVAIEHIHLTQDGYEKSITHLIDHGYHWSKGEWDIIAVRQV